MRAQARGRTAVAETARRRRGALQEGETRNAEREPGDCAQADEACRSPIPQRSGLIWVQNPSSYVAMSRKVPPQAVTSRRRGGNRGVRHLVTNFSTEGPGRGIADCGGSLPKGHWQHCRTGICTGYVSNASVLTLSVFRGRGLKTPKKKKYN